MKFLRCFKIKSDSILKTVDYESKATLTNEAFHS